MRGALLILKKEFMEFSKDRKTMFFTLVMPILLYPLLFGMINKLDQSDSAKLKGKPSRVLLLDPENLVTPSLKSDSHKFELVDRPVGDLKDAIRQEKLELAVEVEPGAAAKAARLETYKITATRDESVSRSALALKRFKEAVKLQDQTVVSERLMTLKASPQLAAPTNIVTEEASDAGRSAGKAIGAFLPYIVMMMMLAGSMQHGIYATAGERERGTLLTLLATSLPRNQIIWGKLLYIFCMGVITAFLNMMSMGFSMAQMVGHKAAVAGAPAAAGTANGALGPLSDPVTLLLAFILMVPLGLLFSNFILFLGIQAKNTVEAGTAITPLLIVVMFMGMFTMAPGVDKMPLISYLPIVNVSMAIRKLFSQQGNTLEYLVALFMTIGLAGIMTWVSTRIINRESAIFKA